MNVIIEKLDIKLKRQKIKKIKKMVRYDYLKKCVLARFEEHQTCFYFKNDLTKKIECLPSLDQDVVTLANIGLNDNVSDNNDSNIGDSKEEELQFSLNTGCDVKANEEDDTNTFTEMASNEQIFENLFEVLSHT